MFNEKSTEFSKKRGGEIPVWKSPKYEEAKKKAIELIKSKKYDLDEGDFWILMNETSTGKMQYTGLIISHNGCLKINDKSENKFRTDCITLDKEGYKNSLVYTYKDEDVFEVGEVSQENCKNAYPYAMALKRCFDRVVLKKCKLAYAGVYSDSEADEFSKIDLDDEKPKTITKTQAEALAKSIANKQIAQDQVELILEKYDYKKIEDISINDYTNIVKEFQNLVGNTKIKSPLF